MNKTICVFCSASDVAKEYVDAATDLGTRMAQSGFDLVWGGSNTGIMKVVADSVQNAGGKLIGISVTYFHHLARPHADEMIVTKDLSERKKILLDRGDAIVLLVGGVGSLDEIAEIVELKKQNVHNKPVVVINTNGFYDNFRDQLQKMYADGFINKPIDDLIQFVATPEEAIAYITSNI